MQLCRGRAVLCRGRLLSPHHPPCTGAGSWLCLLEALHIPVRGSLAFETSPGTEAVGSRNKQPKGSSDACARRCLPALGWRAWRGPPAPLGCCKGVLGWCWEVPVQVTREEGHAEQVPCRMQSDCFLGSREECRRNAVVTCALGTGYRVGHWQGGVIHDRYGKGW